MDVSNFSRKQLNSLRNIFHALNHFMIFMWKIGLGRWINIWPAVIGQILVIKHHGRRSGKEYLTPVNYAIVDGEIYCMAGFGSVSDWYRNMQANPNIDLWLPEGKRKAHAVEVSVEPRRIFLIRQIVIASGFAGPLFGINQKKLNDEQLDAFTKDYCLVRFIMDRNENRKSEGM